MTTPIYCSALKIIHGDKHVILLYVLWCIIAKVSWHWKSIVELDQLWMPKCLKLGWMLTFSPFIHESGMWKRLYIENMVALKTSVRHVSYCTAA